MGWFDEQIRLRIRQDSDSFSDAFDSMASAIVGSGFQTRDAREKSAAAVDEVLRYYRIRSAEVPDTIEDFNDRLEYLIRPAGVMQRRVALTGRWYREAVGPMLAMKTDGSVIALMPTGVNGYSYFDYGKKKRIRVTARTADEIEKDAICFYKPLPQKSLGIPDLMLYMFSTLNVWDFVLIGIATLAVTVIGMLVPYLNNLIFDQVIPAKQMNLILPMATAFLGVTVSSTLIGIVKSIIEERLSTKTNVAVQAASMMRVLSLPADFFRTYDSGELNVRVNSINTLCSTLADMVLNTGLTGVFSLAYISQIVQYAPPLALPAIAVILAQVAFSVIDTFIGMKYTERELTQSAKNSGIATELISSVQKIKLAGAEKRAFSKWARAYAVQAKLEYNPPFLIKYGTVVSTALTLFGTVILYFCAGVSGVSVADYAAFNAAYGMVSGAILSLGSLALTAAEIRPTLKLVEPLLKTVPEVSEECRPVTKLTGAVELNNITFRYSPDSAPVLRDISFKVRPGEYVAVVGRTGCGKSTLIRLLLGFEQPEMGAVYYDGHDLKTLDPRSVRRNIGVVLQDGKLFPGDIYSNITISAPWLSLKDAWEAAELAGIKEDIEQMPMGMHTLLGGGSTGISGGQAQRLMIARAVAPKPQILIFDEATSALDNITQKQISESLASLKCTRIVVAHRLSTIRQCNRILVLDGGRIVEDGTYEELIRHNGLFADLVHRQRLDIGMSESE